MSPALAPPNRDRTAATDALVLAAGARLAPAGPIGVGRLAAEAGVSKPSARAAVRRLSARGAWPHGPLDPRPGRPTSEPVGLAERVLEAAARLAPLGPISGNDLARETGLPRTSVYPLVARLRARGAWPHGGLSGVPAPASGAARGAATDALVLAAADRLAPRGPFTGGDLARVTRLPADTVYSAVRRLRARGAWPHEWPGLAGAAPPDGAPVPPPADVARALASARPERRPAPPRGHLDPGEAAAACRRLLRAWRRYRKGEPRPLLIAAGLLSRRKWEGDES